MTLAAHFAAQEERAACVAHVEGKALAVEGMIVTGRVSAAFASEVGAVLRNLADELRQGFQHLDAPPSGLRAEAEIPTERGG